MVYGAPAYPYPSYYYPGYVAGAALTFGVGLAIGAAWNGGYWGNCNWNGGGNVNINNNNNFNRNTNINGGNRTTSTEAIGRVSSQPTGASGNIIRNTAAMLPMETEERRTSMAEERAATRLAAATAMAQVIAPAAQAEICPAIGPAAEQAVSRVIGLAAVRGIAREIVPAEIDPDGSKPRYKTGESEQRQRKEW